MCVDSSTLSLLDNEAVFNFSEAKNGGEGIWNKEGEVVVCREGNKNIYGLGAGIIESIKDLISESPTFPKSQGILVQLSRRSGSLYENCRSIRSFRVQSKSYEGRCSAWVRTQKDFTLLIDIMLSDEASMIFFYALLYRLVNTFYSLDADTNYFLKKHFDKKNCF